MRMIRWALMNGGFAAALWFGLAEGVEGAQNVVLFIVWFLFVISFGSHEQGVIDALRKKGRSVPAFVEWTFEIAVVVALVWSGWWLSAIAYTFHAAAFASAYDKALKPADTPA